MSKAILTLKKMPDHCGECPLWEPHKDWGTAKGRCIITDGALDRTVMLPIWCPLKEAPERRETEDTVEIMRDAEAANRSTLQQIGYNRGWNDCLDDIIGGAE